MSPLKFFRRAESKADAYLDIFIGKLLEAEHAAQQAVQHAVKKVAVHDAAIAYHHEQQAIAADLHTEAKTALEDVGKVLARDVAPAVETAAAVAVEGEVK